MTFQQSIKICLRQKYLFCFKGRASRSEFWWFMCFIFLVNLASGILFSFFPPLFAASFSLVISLVLFPANLGVTVRRLHDRSMSGWWLLLPIISLFLGLSGGVTAQNPTTSLLSFGLCLVYLIILCMPGTQGENKYGNDPLMKEANI